MGGRWCSWTCPLHKASPLRHRHLRKTFRRWRIAGAAAPTNLSGSRPHPYQPHLRQETWLGAVLATQRGSRSQAFSANLTKRRSTKTPKSGGVVGAAEAAEGGGSVGAGVAVGRHSRSQSHGAKKLARQEYDRAAARAGVQVVNLELAVGRRILVSQITHAEHQLPRKGRRDPVRSPPHHGPTRGPRCVAVAQHWDGLSAGYYCSSLVARFGSGWTYRRTALCSSSAKVLNKRA